jgi:hypothetical protein
MGPEFAFVAEPHDMRAVVSMHALRGLGYDARTYGLDAVAAELMGAKVVVVRIFDSLKEEFLQNPKLICDMSEVPTGQELELCRRAAGRGARFSAASEHLAQAASRLLGRPVEHVPEPADTAQFEPRAARARRRSRALDWLAERAGLEKDPWRLRLLWSGGEAELESLAAAAGALERLGRELPLELRCLAPPGPALEALADRLVERDPDALRIALQAWSMPAQAQRLGECDFVLLPGSVARLASSLYAGRLALARPHPEFGALAGYAWVGEDPCEGIRWALADPRAALERLRRGQQYVNPIHAPSAVARAWVRMFMKGA